MTIFSWAEAASAFGAKWAVLTAKHISGFCIWPTVATVHGKRYPYSVAFTKWGGGQRDVVAEFAKSFQRRGIKPAIYYSVSTNMYLNVSGGIPQNLTTITQNEYNDFVMKQLTELWTQYGELAELWFDGGLLSPSQGGPDLVPLIQKYQPNAMAFNAPQGYSQCVRWVGNEDGVAPDPNWSTCDPDNCGGGGSPDGTLFCPAECDTVLWGNGNHIWFWEPDGPLYIKTINQLMDEYIASVGHNSNYLLNINPNRRGLIDHSDMQRYIEFGAYLQSFKKENAIVETAGNDYKLQLTLPDGAYVDHLIIEEDQSKGQLVQLYVIESKINGQWQLVANGSSIGHKKIDVVTPLMFVSDIRWVCLEAVDTPTIKRFAAYYIGPDKPLPPMKKKKQKTKKQKKRERSLFYFFLLTY